MKHIIKNKKMSHKIEIKNYEKTNFNQDVCIPINQICDIDVEVTIKYVGFSKTCNCLSTTTPHICVMFFIHSKNCKYFDIEDEEKILLFAEHNIFKINEFRILTDNEYEIIQNCVKEILDKINFNKFSGKFFKGDIKDEEDSKNFLCKCVGDNPLIKKSYGECCVCYEDTLINLDCCKGFICYKCWSNIKPKNEFNNIACPLCRNLINSKETIDDDE